MWLIPCARKVCSRRCDTQVSWSVAVRFPACSRRLSSARSSARIMPLRCSGDTAPWPRCASRRSIEAMPRESPGVAVQLFSRDAARRLPTPASASPSSSARVPGARCSWSCKELTISCFWLFARCAARRSLLLLLSARRVLVRAPNSDSVPRHAIRTAVWKSFKTTSIPVHESCSTHSGSAWSGQKAIMKTTPYNACHPITSARMTGLTKVRPKGSRGYGSDRMNLTMMPHTMRKANQEQVRKNQCQAHVDARADHRPHTMLTTVQASAMRNSAKERLKRHWQSR
mmetsp:Transcript_43999/g.124558  ORF Transcript_43999/g.124558 Transcript_43999/m.124558 type:complete len:285 (-) Transcript_43999:512-1366(-)